jgi:osmotically-inducible protein OsmY
VEHGEVHLKGFVQDPRTLLAANQVATQAAGDHKIVNELLIKENYPNAP